MRWSARLRNGQLGFGPLVKRRLTAAETQQWVAPYLTDAGVRRDVARFPAGLGRQGPRRRRHPAARFERPVLLAWAPADRFFKIALGERLAETFPDARLVEIPDARTFVALDQPERLAEEIACVRQ